MRLEDLCKTASNIKQLGCVCVTTLGVPLQSKDTVDLAKQGGIVYRIPCECSKVNFERLADLCKTGSKRMTKTSDFSIPRPLLFQGTLTISDTTRFGIRLS